LLFALTLGALSAPATMRLPEASGETVYEKNGAHVDASNTDQGYFMANCPGDKTAMIVAAGKGKLQYFFRDGSLETFPLQMGDGTYKLQIVEQVSGNKYAAKMAQDIKVKLTDESLPFLYPNQYVNYKADSKAVALSEELCADVTSDADKLDIIFQYVSTNLTYDYDKAKLVQNKDKSMTNYLPVIDDVLDKKTGICFDYSALMACMLRVQGIPTRLVIGYADKIYHAWNLVLVDGTWTRYDATFESTGATVKKYTDNFYY